jgi:hypothetical protein
MMSIQVFTPVAAGQSATCRVAADNESGYVKVKVNHEYVAVLPDEHPGVSDDRRQVFCPRLGKGYDVWSNPLWKLGDVLEFELYDSNDQMCASQVTVVL